MCLLAEFHKLKVIIFTIAHGGKMRYFRFTFPLFHLSTFPLHPSYSRAFSLYYFSTLPFLHSPFLLVNFFILLLFHFTTSPLTLPTRSLFHFTTLLLYHFSTHHSYSFTFLLFTFSLYYFSIFETLSVILGFFR